MRHRIVAAVIAVSLFLPLPLQAHTDSELAGWQADWNSRLEQSGGVLTRNLVWEFIDMRRRHPCQLAECPQIPPSSVRASTPVARAYTGMGSNVEQWRALVASYFAASLVDHALCILQHESGGNPDAKNPTSSASGLFQHLASYWPERSSAAGWGGSSIWDPEANTAVAAWLYNQGGWGHWTANRHC